ncbi:MAG TPA: tripartite tricarboxylate transporter substrate binding protein [Burkholderiales bacterium]|nr:tripartite tricarboxylate transporter substrate binding protein [Burkholderiales bacterium]
MRAAIVCRIIACAAFAASTASGQAASKASGDASSTASGQAYPTRPIRLLIPFPPGGGADISGRIIGKALGERLGVQFVADNRPGASTMIATDIVAKATPDGYTLLMATGTHTINPSIFVKRPFDEVADFTPIVVVSNSPNMVAINPKLPIKTIPDLVAHAKANPGKVDYGTGGHGTHQHMAFEFFRAVAGIQLTHVPYKGGVPAINDAMGGSIAMAVVSVPGLAPYVKAGRLRALAVTSAKRSSTMPEIPTIAEQGYPGFDVNYWLGLMGPAKLPPAIIRRINEETNAAIKVTEVRETFIFNGAEPAGGTPEHFAALVKREIKEWAEVVKKTGITPQ